MGMAPAHALNCAVYSFTLTNGTTADANQVMSNFNTIMNCANTNLAHNGANSDITSLTGLSTPLAPGQGGTGVANAGTLTIPNNLTTAGSGTPTLSFPAGALTYTYPTVTDTLAGIAATQTLTHKTMAFGSLDTNVLTMNGQTINLVSGSGTALVLSVNAAMNGIVDIPFNGSNPGIFAKDLSGNSYTCNGIALCIEGSATWDVAAGAGTHIIDFSNTQNTVTIGDLENGPTAGLKLKMAVTNGAIFLQPAGTGQVQIASHNGLTQNSTAPTMGACGTSPSISGTDGAFAVTTGTGGPTTCVVNFGATWSGTPVCVSNTNSSTISSAITALSATAMTMTFSAAFTSGVARVHCFNII